MQKKDRIDEFEALHFRHCRDHNGNVIPINVGKRNGIPALQFPSAITEPYFLPEDENAPDYLELVEEVCQGLSEKERRRWLLAVRDKRSFTEIAQMEGVSRQAIIDCFHRMAKKNPYVRIYLDHTKNKRNQHK